MKNFRFIVTIVILLVAAGFNHYFSKPDISLPRKSLAEFPRELGDWSAMSDQRMDDGSMRILQVDDYILRNYRNSKGETIGLYVGYYKSQREGKGIHSPRQCLPGAGWFPINTSVYYLLLKNHKSDSVPVNRYVMGKGLDRELYLFWYEGRGRTYASEYWNVIYLVFDAITKRRTDGALLRVNNMVKENADEALKTQTEFIQLFFPLLKDYIPD